MGRNCFKAVLYGLKGYLRRSRSVCTASYMCVRRHSREHGNRVEAATPPSTLRPARVRRKAENTLHGPCHKKGTGQSAGARCPLTDNRGNRVWTIFWK